MSYETIPREKLTYQRDIRAETSRAELLGSGASPADDPYSDEPSGYSTRTRLLAGSEQLQDGSRRLDNTQRIALETEDLGAGILRDLRGQREQIEHTRDTVSNIPLVAEHGLRSGVIADGVADTSGQFD